MYTTKLTVEFTVKTQFGPLDAITVIDVLTRCPAIESVSVKKVKSDYKIKKDFPKDNQSKALRDIKKGPIKIR